LQVLQASVGDAKIVQDWQDDIDQELHALFDTDAWRAHFPGRTILKAFVDRVFSGGISYQHFVTLIVNQMVVGGYRPPGMRSVLAAVAPVDAAGVS